ncbi:hypothetical protein F2Q69_00011263 [Brassica cretica]|uniref:Uncharacterized protein n=1 Tax=Brassica cretica TaxID=69181 RepID=A0A8S9R3H7_BRACR|nr:hypothetical protein F2Q69_00011263 [Brassica cretica]
MGFSFKSDSRRYFGAYGEKILGSSSSEYLLSNVGIGPGSRNQLGLDSLSYKPLAYATDLYIPFMAFGSSAGFPLGLNGKIDLSAVAKFL